jgi:peptidoglycan biosynthesis protein MviN/MurJ (putative lipid II flippase)
VKGEEIFSSPLFINRRTLITDMGETRVKSRAELGGILAIVSGVLGIFSALGFVFFIFLIDLAQGEIDYGLATEEDIYIMAVLLAIIGVIMLIISALSIVGGILAYRKRHWGWALAGSIGASMVFYPAGIAAVIFISLARPEFSKKGDIAPATPQTWPPAVNQG